MGKYGDLQEDFYAERDRILNALRQDENCHMILRLLGALAFRTHCPQYGYIQDDSVASSRISILPPTRAI